MSAPLARWNMTLTIGAERTIANPSEAQIESALRSLTDGGDAFAILASGEGSYIQAAGSAAETFRLEYRDGSESEHYHCPADLHLQQVLDAFVSYRRGDSAFKHRIAWARGTGEVSRHRGPVLVLALMVALGALLMLWQVSR
jgi:hypothetical protein